MNIAIPLVASVHVLFAGTQPIDGTTWLQGVDHATHRAWVTHESSVTDSFAVETIDLSAQTSTLATATSPRARSRWFHPMTSDPVQSLVAYADLVERTGPFVTRARDYAGPHMVVSRTLVAYEAPTDAIMVAQRDGSNAHRVATTLDAAYHPILASDGAHIAYTGCSSQGRTCPYRLFVGPVAGPQIAVPGITSPEPPVFSPDARFVYVAAQGCAFRVDVSTGAASRLACSSALTAVELREADDGRTAIFFGHTRANALEVHVLDLPSGAERRVWTVPDRLSVELGNDHILALGGEADLVVVDLDTGRQRTIVRRSHSIAWLSNQWRDGHTFYAIEHDVRTGGRAPFRILEVDARDALRN